MDGNRNMNFPISNVPQIIPPTLARDSPAVEVIIDAQTQARLQESINVPLRDVTNDQTVQKQTYNKFRYTESEQNNYIYQILFQSFAGQDQLKAFKCDEILSTQNDLIENGNRKLFNIGKVSKLIIGHELLKSNSSVITSERLNELAKNASSLFNCLKETFYTHATAGYGQGGALSLALKGIRARSAELDHILFPTSSSPSQSLNKRKRLVDDFEESEEFIQLKKPVDNIDETYINEWSDKAFLDRLEFYKKRSLETILNTFPNLKNVSGRYLVNKDYCRLFNKDGNDTDVFLKNWTTIAQKVLKIAKKSKVHGVKGILDESEITDEEHTRTAGFILLPYLFKKVNKISAKSKIRTHWSPDHSVVLNTFIYYTKVTDVLDSHISEAIASVQKIHNDHTLLCGPFIAIFGPSLKDIRQSLVIINNDVKYQVSSCSLAVKVCFESLKVYQKKSSVVCDHIWEFLEHVAFGFSRPKPERGMVTSVIETLNKTKI